MNEHVNKSDFIEGKLKVSTVTMKEPKAYKLDLTKIKTVEDVVKVFGGLQLIVYDNANQFESLKAYLKEV
ncbi:hypothetical protein ACI3ER_11385 [Bacillus sp. Wb]